MCFVLLCDNLDCNQFLPRPIVLSWVFTPQKLETGCSGWVFEGGIVNMYALLVTYGYKGDYLFVTIIKMY